MDGYDNYVIFAGKNKLRIEGDEIVIFEPSVNSTSEMFDMMSDAIKELAFTVRDLEIKIYKQGKEN